MVRNVKKLVPEYNLPGAVRFNAAIALGTKAPFKKPETRPDDIAVLQYTGGTTGVSKGAVLLHRNVIANVLLIGMKQHSPHLKIVPISASIGDRQNQRLKPAVG